MQECLDILKECWLKVKGFFRAPCPTLCKHWLIVLLAVYAVLSLGYQASAPWRERTFSMERTEYRVMSSQDPVGEYRLAIHYPKKIPIEAVGERGRPLVAWLWRASATATATSPVPANVSPTTTLSLSTSITPTAAISISSPITSSTRAFIPSSSAPVTGLPGRADVSAVTALSPTTEITATMPITWRLLIMATSADTPSVVSQANIIFTDKNGLEIASVLNLQAGTREAEAPRAILYISRFTNGQQENRARLDFQLWRGDYQLTLIPTTEVPITVNLETRCAAFWRKLCDLFLNTPALSWVSILSICANFLIKQHEKKVAEARELQNQVQALKEMPIKQAWETFWNLYKTHKANDSRQSLKRAWREIETFYPFETSRVIREWLTDHIQQDEAPPEDRTSWDEMAEAQSSLSKEEIETLKAFFVTGLPRRCDDGHARDGN